MAYLAPLRMAGLFVRSALPAFPPLRRKYDIETRLGAMLISRICRFLSLPANLNCDDTAPLVTAVLLFFRLPRCPYSPSR